MRNQQSQGWPEEKAKPQQPNCGEVYRNRAEPMPGNAVGDTTCVTSRKEMAALTPVRGNPDTAFPEHRKLHSLYHGMLLLRNKTSGWFWCQQQNLFIFLTCTASLSSASYSWYRRQLWDPETEPFNTEVCLALTGKFHHCFSMDGARLQRDHLSRCSLLQDHFTWGPETSSKAF